MKKPFLMLTLAILAFAAAAPPAGRAAEANPFITLPDKYNSPDGMMLGQDGNIYLNACNINEPAHPPMLLKIDANDQITEMIEYPVNPESQRVVPMGIDQGPDGHFYVADNQAPVGQKDKGRLLRVVMENGKAVRVEPVVTGMNSANAVAIRDGFVYVTETRLDTSVYPLPSGIYRFKIDELKGEKPLQVQPGGKDGHLIATFTTRNKEIQGGANGMGFNAKGEMFVCNFGDAQIIKFTFDQDGKVASQAVFAEGQGMSTCDGLKVDAETGNLYVADLYGNAVHKIDGQTGKVTTLAKDAINDGSNGRLDICSEVCLRGDKIYVANLDLPRNGNTFDKPYTITILNNK